MGLIIVDYLEWARAGLGLGLKLDFYFIYCYCILIIYLGLRFGASFMGFRYVGVAPKPDPDQIKYIENKQQTNK